MKYVFLSLLISYLGFSRAQERPLSLDSLSGFTCFDTITVPLEWHSLKVYYPDSTLLEDIRFRIWGDGCQQDQSGKCFYRFQRQTFFENGKIQEKEGGYGWIDPKSSKSIYQLLVYNRKGKLMYVEKKKKK